MTTSLSLIALPDGKELDHRLGKLRSKKCMHEALAHSQVYMHVYKKHSLFMCSSSLHVLKKYLHACNLELHACNLELHACMGELHFQTA